MAQSQDVEINLGAGRLLGLFFALVVMCAIFFGLGYSLGKNSSPQTSLVATEPGAQSAAQTKPRAGSTPTAAPGTAQPASDQLTFYKRVEQKEPTAQLSPAPAPGESAPPAPPAPEMAKPSGTYIVQVAAVSKQEDAQVLVSALRKKNYPVFVNNNSPGDKLYHVQIGPFADINEAEGMRSRLAGDGYNPILKK